MRMTRNVAKRLIFHCKSKSRQHGHTFGFDSKLPDISHGRLGTQHMYANLQPESGVDNGTEDGGQEDRNR